MNITELVFFDKCISCGACAAICPVNALNMKAGQDGFLYPKVSDRECISCGKCTAVCPAYTVSKNRLQ